MPLSRHTVGNEYALGGRDLYRAADQHDPEAVLDGVAMAGLVGVLRQLGDLAEFAAQVFHGLYDEVMSTSARGHGLMLRVQQLEAELPLLEKDSCQIDYLHIASNKGVDWHSNPRVDHGVVTRGDTPRFIMESIKQCRGPPKLFMLDKYDIGGEGACLKRYTDPSFFKTDSACSTLLQEGIHNERRPLKAMEIRPNLQNAEIFLPPNGADNVSKLETDLSGEDMAEVATNRRRLKYRQLNGSVFQRFRPLMQNLYEKPPSEKLVTVDHSKVHISMTDSPESNTEERDIMVDTSMNMEKGKVTIHKNRSIPEETLSRSSDARSAGSSKGYNSEVDIYMDALTTMDSEVETDSEHKGHGLCTFDQMDSDNRFPNAQNAMASSTSSFEKKDTSDVASANRDMSNQHEEAIVSTQHIKPAVGEHERTSSLEELLEQEKPASWEHERTSSLEGLLIEDFNAPESGIIEQATEEPSCNGSVTSVVSNGTQDFTKKTKEVKENSNIATISFKKIASKRSKYVGSMELIASKVGILPKKLSKKHDPFSDSLRYMAKQLLELKYDGTQDSDLYEFEVNGVGCDVTYQEMYDPLAEIKASDACKIPSDSPHDDVGSRNCLQEEVNHELEHDVPPTDSPHDSVPDEGNGFLDSNIVYLTSITSSSSSEEEEGCASTALDDNSSSGVPNHILEHAQEKFEEHFDREVNEDIHTEVSENAPEKCEDLKEVGICTEQVNVEDIEEINQSDVYALDDETCKYIEEQVISDGMISSPVSSKQSDDPCRITPLTLAGEEDTVSCKVIDSYTPEVENISLSETFRDFNIPNVVTESVINSEDAMLDNEQYCLLPETTFGQDPVIGSYEIVGKNEQVELCSSTAASTTPEVTVNREEKLEFHQAVHQESSTSFNRSNEDFGDPLVPDSRDVPPLVISSFDWMLNGAMQQSFNIIPSHSIDGNAQENGSSEDAPPLPPLPPMQWRTNNLQTGSSPLSAKIGRPPRPKPPVKQESEAARVLQEKSLHKGSSLQNEVVQAIVSSDHEINQTLNLDSHENHHQEGVEYDAQDSNPFPSSEVECMAELASVKNENLHTLQLPGLIVIPKEAWSEFGNINFIPEQEGKHQLSNGLSVCNGLHTSGLSAQKANEKPDYKGKEFSDAGNDKIAGSEENKPNSALNKQDDMLNPDLPAQQKDNEHDGDDREREFFSALEEGSSKSPTHTLPKPPRYPLLPVTSHDRSMLRKAPTLVQPSSKLSDEDTLLEQIKNKSFNLKPVLAKRPNVMGGPKTNLQVVAILERAHAIRQAVADDDDEDSWSE